MAQPQTPPAPGNTHAVGAAGLVAAAIGIFGPTVLEHVFPHAPPDVKEAAWNFLLAIASGGTLGAYFGKPQTVKSSLRRFNCPIPYSTTR